ncbi:hypothetical protein [Nitrosopumilus spindle-shaped virus]|uniref:Gene product 88 domain-containing protein n=1 Tax=Nitrosopumilus spindle-shaped virus TaxID=2508184 RepID=A0A514K3A6_9VIRU|nr:hypothetical protein [Nitrosopumilus spindle-shaped virus]
MKCTSRKLKYLSRNSKLLFPSFDITLKNCVDICDYGSSNLCYAKNNPRIMIFNKPKLERNEKLLNSKNFVNEIKTEINLSNSRKVRFFSSGDIYKIDHLEKIEKLCEQLPKIIFWLSTHNEKILYDYYTRQNKKPIKNLNVILSHKIPNEKPPKFYLDYWNKQGINISYTTNEKSLSNCHSSINRTSCDLCEKCFDGENIVYYLHGTYAEKRLKKYEDSKN